MDKFPTITGLSPEKEGVFIKVTDLILQAIDNLQYNLLFNAVEKKRYPYKYENELKEILKDFLVIDGSYWPSPKHIDKEGRVDLFFRLIQVMSKEDFEEFKILLLQSTIRYQDTEI